MKQFLSIELVNKKAILKNTNIQIVGTAINSVVGLLATALMARYLGTIGFGKINLAMVYLSFSGIIAGMGYQTIIVREISKLKIWDEDIIRAILSGGIILRLLSVMAALLILSLYLLPLDYDIEFKLQILLMASVHFVDIANIFECIVRSKLRLKYVVYASIIFRLSHLLLIFSCVLLQLSLTYFIFTFLVAAIIKVAMAIQFSKKFIRFHFIFNWQWIRFLFRHSVLLGISGGLWIIYYRIDSLMLEFFMGIREVGLYNSAFRFIDYAYLLSGMLMASIFPLMAERYPGNPEGMRRIYQKTIDYTAIIGGALSIGILLASVPLIKFIFGVEYLPAVTTLRIFGFIPLLIFLNNAFGNMMVALELQGKPLLCMRSVGVLINVGLNLVCIPAFGYNGAAFATVATELSLLAVVIVIIGRKILFYPSLRNFFLMLALCSAVFAATLSSINPLVVAIGASVVFITMVAGVCRYDRSELLAAIFMKVRE